MKHGAFRRQSYVYVGIALIAALMIGRGTDAHASAAVRFKSPAEGAKVSGPVSITAKVSAKVSWVDFYLDGNNLASSPPYSFSWDPTAVSNGKHTISATAFNANNKILGKASVKIMVHEAGAAPNITGTAYYVDSVGGSDSNSGTSPDSPWQTIAQVGSVLSALQPGDGVLFKAGDVWKEQLDLSGGVAGSASHPIVFASYDTGAKPVIDGGGSREYCIDALSGAVRYVVIDGFECRYATKQGVTFQTTSGMPGIIVENMYIHNTGPGACCGSAPYDDGNYANQLDFEDFSEGADGVQFEDNTVNHCGGHNCLEVHYDTGPVVITGNVVGPGCVHGCIDTKGIGTRSAPALITNNIATCGLAQGLCGTQTGNPEPAFYFENIYTPQAAVSYQENVAYDSGVGFQLEGGGCANVASNCSNQIAYYNNTVYVPSQSYAFYAAGGNDSTVALANNIWDGGMVEALDCAISNEDYNDIGGLQGNTGFAIDGSSTLASDDLLNINPEYVDSSASPPNLALQAGSPLINAGEKGLISSNDIGAY